MSCVDFFMASCQEMCIICMEFCICNKTDKKRGIIWRLSFVYVSFCIEEIGFQCQRKSIKCCSVCVYGCWYSKWNLHQCFSFFMLLQVKNVKLNDFGDAEETPYEEVFLSYRLRDNYALAAHMGLRSMLDWTSPLKDL